MVKYLHEALFATSFDDGTCHADLGGGRCVAAALPGGTDNSGVFLLDNDGYVLPVDMSSCRERLSELIVGSIVRATGICIFNIENYRPNTVFPQITGFTLDVVDNEKSVVEVGHQREIRGG